MTEKNWQPRPKSVERILDSPVSSQNGSQHPLVGSSIEDAGKQSDGFGQHQNITQWSTGICGCFDDCGICCFALCCSPCHLCRVAAKLNESCCVPLCLANCGLMAMRTKLRTAYGIQGSICADYCCASFCPLLVQCQLHREMDSRGTNIF